MWPHQAVGQGKGPDWANKEAQCGQCLPHKPNRLVILRTRDLEAGHTHTHIPHIPHTCMHSHHTHMHTCAHIDVQWLPSPLSGSCPSLTQHCAWSWLMGSLRPVILQVNQTMWTPSQRQVTPLTGTRPQAPFSGVRTPGKIPVSGDLSL